MEDRFLTHEMMLDLSRALEAAGFAHVTVAHLIDPQWRSGYRPRRPELEPVAWTVRLQESLIPMHQTKKLIEICEPRGLVFWVSSDGGDCEFYLKVAHPESGAKQRGL